MKYQYLGDINDYHKYGLLRAISNATELKTLVAWMLTPDDDSIDGQRTKYLECSHKWKRYDPELYCVLKETLNKRKCYQNQKIQSAEKNLSQFEKSSILKRTNFYSALTPDNANGRVSWFNVLLREAKSTDIVFLDPDNGLEIESKHYGQKKSSKYLYWREVNTLWQNGKSLLIYQHFRRKKRDIFIQNMLNELTEKTKGSHVVAFRTSHVVFLMALQPKHQKTKQRIIDSVQKNWAGQIESVNLETVNEKTRAKTAINELLRAD